MSDRIAALLVSGIFVIGSACFLVGNAFAFLRAWREHEKPPRSKHDCGNCYGNGCAWCGMTGKADMTGDELAEYDDAMERRAEHRADNDMMEKFNGR